MHIQTSNQPKLKMGFGNYTCNWGLHIAGLYETEKERDNIIMGFLHQGCVDKGLQLYCPAERTKEDFIEKFSEKFPESKSHLTDEDIFQIRSVKELYYPDGTFSPFAMDEGLNDFFKKAQKKAKVNIRATAEMVWALDDIPGAEHLMVYESRLNYFIKGKPWISICLYNIAKFDGAAIMNVLRTHPYTISKGVILANPYYQDPDIWLKENAPQFLQKEL